MSFLVVDRMLTMTARASDVITRNPHKNKKNNRARHMKIS